MSEYYDPGKDGDWLVAGILTIAFLAGGAPTYLVTPDKWSVLGRICLAVGVGIVSATAAFWGLIRWARKEVGDGK